MKFPLIVKPKEGYFEDVVDQDNEQIFGIVQDAGFRDNMIELVRRANAYDDLIKFVHNMSHDGTVLGLFREEATRLIRQHGK